jgi:hypothetical protein
VAQIVQEQDIVAVAPDEQSFGAVAGRGPGLDQGVEELPGVVLQDDRAGQIGRFAGPGEEWGNGIDTGQQIAGTGARSVSTGCRSP